MDKVDATVESMLRNLRSLVVGSDFGSADSASPSVSGGKPAKRGDPLLEVVASQLVDNCNELFGLASQLRRQREVGDYAKHHSYCAEEKRKAMEARAECDREIAFLRRDLAALLADLKAELEK